MQPTSKLTKLICTSYIILFLLSPLLISTHTSELFEFPKILFVYASTIIITTIHLFNITKKSQPIFKKHPLNLPLLLFLLSQTISTLWSIDPHTSIYGYYSRFNGGLLSLICYALLFLILNVYITPQFKTKIINTSLVSGFIVSAYAILQHFGIDKNFWVQDVQQRVFSTLGQPNWLSAYLCILTPLAINRFLKSKNTSSKLLYFHLSLVFFIASLFTKSKSGLIALPISLLIYFILNLKQHSKQLLPLFGLLTILALTIPNPIKSKIFPTSTLNDSNHTIPSTINITPSQDIRKIVWQGAIKLWQQYPLFGTGTETFAYSYYWTRPAKHNLTSEWDFIYNKAHNEYLNFLATTGSFGFLTYFLLILISLFQLIHHRQYHLLASFISILITNLAGFSVVITSLYFFLIPTLAKPNQTTDTNPPQPTNFLFKLIIPIVSFYLLKQTWNYYQADLSYNQAQQYQQNQQLQTAQQHLQQAVKLRPSETIYISQLASVQAKLALSQSKTNQQFSQQLVQQSLDNIHSLDKLSPYNLNILKVKAQTYYYLSAIDKKYFSSAIESLVQASLLAPTDAKTFYLLAKFWQVGGNSNQAIKNYLQAIKLKSNYDHACFELAQIYLHQKQNKLAKQYLQQTLQIAPNNTQAQQLLQQIKP
ncbi:hypothetical protein DRH14_00470 [Candidatus Shapirobacteria bacterium]|nr:MAG: hypothetical protein DRH14_00470 [Candidatus Shapirobacteria bacterium]